MKQNAFLFALKNYYLSTCPLSPATMTNKKNRSRFGAIARTANGQESNGDGDCFTMAHEPRAKCGRNAQSVSAFGPPPEPTPVEWVSLLTHSSQMGYSQYKQRKEGTDASILYEVPCQEGDQKPQEHYTEEQEAGNAGHLPDLWHQSIQNRQELGPLRHGVTELREAGHSSYQVCMVTTP